jgi:amino acid transporter
LVMCAIMAIATFFPLDTVINMLVAVIVLVQSVAQIAALWVLRTRQPTLKRPYKMLWYPVPAIVALVGWVYLYAFSGRTIILLSLAWLAAGVVAFLIWASIERMWPFGPKEIREEYLEMQRVLATDGAQINTDKS